MDTSRSTTNILPASFSVILIANI